MSPVIRAQSRWMGPSQRRTSWAKARSSSCVWTRHMACSSVMAKSERIEAKGAVRIRLSHSGPVRSVVDCVSDSHALQFLTARLRVRSNSQWVERPGRRFGSEKVRPNRQKRKSARPRHDPLVARKFRLCVAASRQSAAGFSTEEGGALTRRRYGVIAIHAECKEALESLLADFWEK